MTATSDNLGGHSDGYCTVHQFEWPGSVIACDGHRADGRPCAWTGLAVLVDWCETHDSEARTGVACWLWQENDDRKGTCRVVTRNLLPASDSGSKDPAS